MLVEILRHTPSWVFGLFVLLLALGITQARARRLGRTRLSLLPLAMLGLSLYGAASAFGSGPLALGSWGAALAAVTLASLELPAARGVGYSCAERTFTVPGSWLPLALMMAIFFTKYAVAVALARQPELRTATGFVAAVGGVYGMFSGLFFARALRILRVARA
ncbi:MAG TPA: DUF6622 family protein [Burkholderiales bacterium]|nr:DUF6622 family protein [Burkholderiales bacterium]